MTARDPKVILDACCGGRCCWFDKAHPAALYVDIREAAHGHISIRPNHTVKPDQLADFRALPYKAGRFKLVLWDPPHLFKRNGKEGIMQKKYGSLDRKTWADDIRLGFKECMRVLKRHGVLIFKWNENEVPLDLVLKLFPKRPLFGHTTDRKGATHWLCFMKGVP